MDQWEIEARLGIEDTIGRYVRAADGGRFEDQAALFTEDGVLETDLGPCAGRAAIIEMLNGTKATLAASPDTGGRIRHHVSSLRIDFDGSDAANATCYFLAIVGPAPDHWGLYRDRLVRVGDRWLFAHRCAIVEGRVPGGWAAQRLDGDEA
jgi:hypothetical protein